MSYHRSVTETEGLKVAGGLYEFLRNEVSPGMIARRTGRVLLRIVHDLGPKNRVLLAKRNRLQSKIHGWYRTNSAPVDLVAYRVFLRQIGYLVPEASDLKIQTSNLGPEIASVAGPQLVVLVMSLRPVRRTARHDEEYRQDGIMTRSAARPST